MHDSRFNQTVFRSGKSAIFNIRCLSEAHKPQDDMDRVETHAQRANQTVSQFKHASMKRMNGIKPPTASHTS